MLYHMVLGILRRNMKNITEICIGVLETASKNIKDIPNMCDIYILVHIIYKIYIIRGKWRCKT
jgi:hypothetical protein